MIPISNTGSVPKTVTWYWHFVCTEPNFSIWWDILQKSAFTSWYLTVITYKLKLSVSKNWQLFSNFNTHQFWSQKQLKTNWAHFFKHKEHPQCASIWQSLTQEGYQVIIILSIKSKMAAKGHHDFFLGTNTHESFSEARKNIYSKIKRNSKIPVKLMKL